MLHLWIRLVYNCNVWIQSNPFPSPPPPPLLCCAVGAPSWNWSGAYPCLKCAREMLRSMFDERQRTVCDNLSGKARIESHGCPAITPSGKNNVLRTSVPHLIACWMMTNQWIADSEDQIMLTIPNIFRKGYWKARAHFHTISITHILIHAWTIPCKASV